MDVSVPLNHSPEGFNISQKDGYQKPCHLKFVVV